MADGSFGIGKLFGVEVELHWTLIALLLVTLIIPYTFLLIMLLFVCVLIHELLHCIVSMRNGITVRKIVLLPIGGASIIDAVDISPQVEFNVAIAGPLSSLLLAAIFGVFVVVAPPGFPSLVLQYLFQINLLLGLFNLLPAFPTDGGRVFRSYLEKRYGSYKATLLTIKASKYVMAAFMIGTLVYLALIQASDSFKEFVFIWNLLLVFFLYGGASAEQDINEIRKESKGITLKEVLSRHYMLVSPDKNIRELYLLVKNTKEHLLITKIGDGYAYVDLIESKNLKKARSAGDIAIAIPSIEIEGGIMDALELMQSSDRGLLAVTQSGRIAGVVTMPHIKTFLSLHLMNKKIHS
jgi:Zn-dependent protease